MQKDWEEACAKRSCDDKELIREYQQLFGTLLHTV